MNSGNLKMLVMVIFMAIVSAMPLDDYVSAPEEVYKWEKLNDATFRSTLGNTVHVINVTSLDWLDVSKAVGKDGSVWSHLVYIMVPEKLEHRNVSNAYLTWDNNLYPNRISNMFDEDLILADTMAKYTGSVSIAVKQIPNAPIIFPSDPDKLERYEDGILAWAQMEFMNDPNLDPMWLPRMPMVKASYQCMKAAQEFMQSSGIADIEGWIVSGISKRGWTTWDIAYTRCSDCVKIIGIVPLVPIVPNQTAGLHRMQKSYGGFSFAYGDYLRVNFTERIDTPEYEAMFQIEDPIHYWDRLKDIPKFQIVASDDEYMMFDWTNIYYDQIPGEKHLLITPNTEHTQLTNLFDVMTSLTAFMKSVAHGIKARPSFNYTYNPVNGEIAIQMLDSNTVKPKKVSLRYAQNLSKKRRDFRWVFQTNNITEPCTLPFIPLPIQMQEKHAHLQGKDNLCFAPIFWHEKVLHESSPGVYRALPPQPRDGYWMGYYIEVEFPNEVPGGDWFFKNHMLVTTPGWTWPDTLPYDDCTGSQCKGIIV